MADLPARFNNILRIGTRGSRLARWQSDYIAELLRETYPDAQIEIEVISTKGDQILDKPLPAIGGKGLFTLELETALHEGRIDCAVHSLKDLPTDNPDGLVVGAIPKRAPVADVLVSRAGLALADLPHGATIGTSSRRRAAQLHACRSDLNIIDIRGNVPTRINKCLDPNGPYDAIVLAQAGVTRLGLDEHITQVLDFDMMLPAPGQGAIGVQCRAGDDAVFALLTDEATRLAVTAERAFLNKLEGGCSVPVAALASVRDEQLTLHARVIDLAGTPLIHVDLSSLLNGEAITQADKLGRDAAAEAITQGAAEILEALR